MKTISRIKQIQDEERFNLSYAIDHGGIYFSLVQKGGFLNDGRFKKIFTRNKTKSQYNLDVKT